MNKLNKSRGRRRSRSLAGFASKDLCETIPKSLSPSERLLMLLEQSFQYSLSVAQKELMLKKDFDISTFRKKGTECWEKIRAAIEEKNLDKSAVAENGWQCESFLNANIEECNATIAIFEAESEKWTDQISFHRESLEKEIDSSYSINSSEWNDVDQLYNYTDVMKEIHEAEKKLHQQIESLSSAKCRIKGCLDFNKSYDLFLHEKCEDYYHQKVPETPRTLTRRMASAKRYIKPYSKLK